ncbi:DUF11 domain-containing protein [Actinomadura rudentiformis]|uniref:DUF11 domain-containing protein n=1 Tax=Actinomadura rudentiformis TaxID=359158 RepID=A0A6H9Z317_9ACTN|nr:DUF11 domain-containing protein [Actinomadura rudentiformis]
MAKSQHDCLSRSMQEPIAEPAHGPFQAARTAARRNPFRKAPGPAKAAKVVMASLAAAGMIGLTGAMPALAQPADGPRTAPRLSLSKQASLSSARPGQRFRYVLRVRNVGMVPAYRVKLTDHVPAGLKVTKVRGPRCRTGGKASDVTCSWRQVAYRRSVTVRIDVQVSPTAKSGSRLRNRAVLTHPDGRKVATHTLRIIPAKSTRSESAAPKSDPDKPAPNKPESDQPAADKPAADKPASEKPGTDRPDSQKPRPHKPLTNGSEAHNPKAHKPAADRPAGHKPAGRKPAADRPAKHKPAGHKPAGHKPAGHKPAGHKPAGHKPDHPRSPASPKQPARDAEQLPQTGMPMAAPVGTGLALLLVGGIACWRARRSQPASPSPQTDEPA